MRGVSVFSLSAAALAGVAVAQDSSDEDEARQDTVVVTGIRQSLKDSMDYKRDAQGVVDAINAEDIGKFPSTNLAESLQRIPGVSINRVNGEGSQITVRGFGPNFNAVTLNGRTMPTADAPLVGLGNNVPSGTGRSFDFADLAADGIQALEVYKTGRADIASGGIGATVNIVTLRPLERDGFEATIGGKAMMDTSVDTGDDITPEISGLMNWTSPDRRFGVGVFGSYSRRDSAAPSATSAQWNSIPYSQFLATDGSNANIVNAPDDPNTLITTPFDSRYHFSEFSRERTNGQIVAQFEPTDAIRMTADYTFAVNESEEQRYDISNWFGRSFTDVIFDNSPVPTTVFLSEPVDNRSQAMQQQRRDVKDKLNSYGFNLEYDVNDSLTLAFDAHSSKAEVLPNGPMGFSEINVGVEMFATPDAGTLSHGVNYGPDVPIMQIIVDNTAAVSGLTEDELARRAVDPAQAGSSIANQLLQLTQENEVEQFDLRATWELDSSSEIVFGGNYRTQSNYSEQNQFQQVMGNWGGENRGDIEQYAPGALQVYCMSCRFDAPIGGVTLAGQPVNNKVYGLRGDAGAIFAALSPVYGSPDGYDGIPNSGDEGRTLTRNTNNVDSIEEDVMAVYAQFSTEFDIANRPADLSVGIRYEETDVTSSTSSLPTTGIVWQGNQDFIRLVAADANGFSQSASYDNFLPNIDLAVDITDNVRARASYSKTLARAAYNNLFVSGTVGTPNAPTFLGGNVSASSGNPALLPLESENFDVSFEWYYDTDSYLSVGLFEKRVSNFIGEENVSQNLFGVTDVTSGAAGTRSGDAIELLNELGAVINQDNFFAATALIDANGIAAARTELSGLLQPDGTLTSGDYGDIETTYDVSPDGTDPLLLFSVAQPINNQDAKINGLEIQGQHFFGDTGFGVAGSYTIVDGDVGFDNTSAEASQFALVGLSDTANVTLIYENYGFSSRLAYNWRDEFLTNANDGSATFDPVYVEAYSQLDASVSYAVNDHFTLTFEAINLTEEDTRTFQRSTRAMQFYQENAARYYFGGRYKF
ncbi:TonB-dependent receptor [Henriciella sp. AS95]|uniref:TonB-dependent receptor n=1 Tax=Henriciella sp. AS95 TaxID=3135782 RepID=UPI00317F869E